MAKTVSSKGSLELRIKELEAQINKFSLFPSKLSAFSSGSCTNNCTAACTIGCTSGCTGGCVSEVGFEVPRFENVRG